jgi:hypothetical protein
MRTNAFFLGLAGGAALLAILVIVLVLRMAPPRARPEAMAPPDRAPDPPQGAGPRLVRPPRPPAPARVLPAEPRRTRSADAAIIRGEVVAGDGDPDALEQLEVVADDGSDTFAAKVTGARFELRLPPRVYSLTARGGDHVGRVEAVDALAGVAREVLIRLEPAASIEGTIRGADGERLARGSVRALRAGTRHEDANAEPDADGTFVLDGLAAGGRYDLVVRVPGAREPQVITVEAPATGVTIDVEPFPVLRGALGVAPGATCGGDKVTVRGPGGVETVLDLGARCEFEVPVAPGSELLVRVSGEGRHHEAQVTVPATGEPAPLCFNPPCTAPPLASLEARAEHDGCVHHMVMVGGESQQWLCRLSQGRCELEDLPAGVPLLLSSSCRGCPDDGARPLTLTPGRNTVTLPCRRMREIQGVVRRVGSDQAPVPLTVRCLGGSDRVRDSFLFQLRCPADAGEIEYLLDAEPGRWRRLPVAGNGSPVLVELPVP